MKGPSRTQPRGGQTTASSRVEAEVQAAVQEVSVGSEIVMDSGVAGCAGVYITKSCGSAGVSIPGGAPLLGDEACDMSGDATFAKAFSEGLVFLAPLPVLAPLRNLLLDGWEVLWRLWSASFFGGLSWRQCGSYWWMVSFFPDVDTGGASGVDVARPAERPHDFWWPRKSAKSSSRFTAEVTRQSSSWTGASHHMDHVASSPVPASLAPFVFDHGADVTWIPISWVTLAASPTFSMTSTRTREEARQNLATNLADALRGMCRSVGFRPLAS